MRQLQRSRSIDRADSGKGAVINSVLNGLSPLGLARAYKLQGDAAKANAAYENFLVHWKDADPDIPVLKQAKAEYMKA